MNNFVRYYGTVESKEQKRISKIRAIIKVVDVEVDLRITDIMLQEGNFNTGYTIKTEEMLKRSNDVIKHYNILAKGQGNQIIVNNDGTASSGLDFSVTSQVPTTGPIKMETLNRTKKLEILDVIKKDKFLEVDSFNYKIKNDGVETRNYKGSFIGIPSVFGSYTIDMNDRDIANFIFTIKEYDKKDKY